MAYNPIAPTSSRENRKPPTNVPEGATLIRRNGRWYFDTAAADTNGIALIADGRLYLDDSATSGGAVTVIIGGRPVVMEQ